MDDEKLQNVPEQPNDDFSEMEKMLSDAQEKLAQFQQKHAAKQEQASKACADKPADSADNQFLQLCDKLPADLFPLGIVRDGDDPVALRMGHWHRLGVYVGQKDLEKKVLGNLLTAARHVNMQVIVLRRKLFTEFETGVLFQHAQLTPGDASYWNGNASGMEILTRVLHREIVNQNVFRDEFCEKNGIPADAPRRAEKASEYIREQTRPLLVLFESVADLTRSGASEDVAEGLRLYLTASGAYNIYFIGMFSPDDNEAVWQHPLASAFTEAKHALLIGGQAEKQRLAAVPPEEAGETDGFILREGNGYTAGTMPSGDLHTDLDEFAMALQELMRETEAYEEPEASPSDGEQESL